MRYSIYYILVIVLGLMLLAAGIVDIRRKQISRVFIGVMLIVCLAALPFKEKLEICDTVAGFCIGLGAIGLSVLNRGQIGRGDGFVIALLGIVLGFRKCLAVVCLALLIMSIVAVIVVVSKKGNRHTKLPFLPAIFVGYAFCAAQMV